MFSWVETPNNPGFARIAHLDLFLCCDVQLAIQARKPAVESLWVGGWVGVSEAKILKVYFLFYTVCIVIHLNFLGGNIL